MVRSVTLFLFLPFVLGYIVQKQIIKKRGREYFFGIFKSHLGEVKLWALVVVIISMFVLQASLKLVDIHKVGILIMFLVAFFFILFLIALFIGKIFNLGYADTVTMAFTTTARNSEANMSVAIPAFPGRPLAYFAIILGPLIELPMLLFISRILFSYKKRLAARKTAGELQ